MSRRAARRRHRDSADTARPPCRQRYGPLSNFTLLLDIHSQRYDHLTDFTFQSNTFQKVLHVFWVMYFPRHASLGHNSNTIRPARHQCYLTAMVRYRCTYNGPCRYIFLLNFKNAKTKLAQMINKRTIYST